MNDDFEQRLRALFGEHGEQPADDRFDAEVRARIASLRRARRVAVAIGVVIAAGGLAALGGGALATAAEFMAEAPAGINGAVGSLLVSPFGYVLGALATLVIAFRD